MNPEEFNDPLQEIKNEFAALVDMLASLEAPEGIPVSVLVDSTGCRELVLAGSTLAESKVYATYRIYNLTASGELVSTYDEELVEERRSIPMTTSDDLLDAIEILNRNPELGMAFLEWVDGNILEQEVGLGNGVNLEELRQAMEIARRSYGIGID